MYFSAVAALCFDVARGGDGCGPGGGETRGVEERCSVTAELCGKKAANSVASAFYKLKLKLIRHAP